ncbi:4'-phosphopantetheinyl transferase superfamily protein [Streptomyces sp. NPDC005859]|uniref:4'-phosphopantetheinyl transferase family protein n=1 Tax=Streptomyces sp. NPDC005859 TaxID=3157170 RepID=UPI00340AB23D
MAAVATPAVPVLTLPASGPPSALPALPPPGAPPLLWLLRAGTLPPPGAEAGLDRLEAARRSRFARPRDRDRYTAAHLGLRRLLGGYLHRDPSEVVIVREPCPVCGGPTGRPAVAGPGLHFSLSRSGPVALYALARAPVGVDIETAGSAGASTDVARLLHPRERAELDALTPGERGEAFLRCWTRKEARLKGVGAGLSHGIDGTYVGTGPVPSRQPPASGWTLLDVRAAENFYAAVAFRSGTDAS